MTITGAFWSMFGILGLAAIIAAIAAGFVSIGRRGRFLYWMPALVLGILASASALAGIWTGVVA